MRSKSGTLNGCFSGLKITLHSQGWLPNKVQESAATEIDAAAQRQVESNDVTPRQRRRLVEGAWPISLQHRPHLAAISLLLSPAAAAP